MTSPAIMMSNSQRTQDSEVTRVYVVLKSVAALLLSVLVSACATHSLVLAPSTADRPWQDPERPPTPETLNEFTVAPVAQVTQPTRTVGPDFKRSLTLVDLIDLAQRENPQTRTAWNHAREAALAVGMVEATFLPIISANAIGGFQRTTFTSPLIIGPRQYETDLSGFVPALTLGWLVLDFGQRQALLEASQQLSRAANILFNAEHQKIIWNVTTRYYEYTLARKRVALAQEALKNRQRIAKATRARQAAGMATRVESAMSDQGVMQAKLHQVNSQGLERNAYLALLAAIGISPLTQIKVSDEPLQRNAPAFGSSQLTEQAIGQALSVRPDIAASYAAMRASEANIKAVEAEFYPKVFLGGVLASSHTSFNLQGLPSFSQPASSTGVLIGVTLPIYDGGVRSARLTGAQIRSEQATQNFEQLQRDAVREIVLAETVLRSALESEQTSRKLVSTAQLAYDAALDSYQEGLTTITMATEAANTLLHSREALLESQIASKIAAANLAFATGQMTSSRENWLQSADKSTSTRPVARR